MRDPAGREVLAEVPAVNCDSVVATESELTGTDAAFEHGGVDALDGFVVAATQLDDQPAISRVQQSTIACR